MQFCLDVLHVQRARCTALGAGKRRSNTGSLAHCHHIAHALAGGCTQMGLRGAASCDEHTFHAKREQAAVGEVVAVADASMVIFIFF